ncbi:MAG: hypothetical protein M1818_002575 [Claussenomyces sp. TS43310]|nr:MAG: hypothetical protein M1818_002575 [Claussenomyces sp. TS43310]
MRSSTLLALASSISSALAVYQGFNYGSTQTDGSVKDQQTFEDEFTTAKGLVGTDGGFTSARLYTMIQGGTTSDVIQAIPAAIKTQTSLLLGLWASGGDAAFQNELTALKSAISTYGSDFTKLVAGISVGSEDLYRITPTGIAAKSGVGASPDLLISYIKTLRSTISGTALSGASVGHVDTWNAWTNGSNSAVIEAVDWLGVDEYPFFQKTMANGIEDGKTLFYNAYDATQAVSGGKDVWITEAGWPVSGSNSGDAVPSLANAKTFWDEVGCPSFGKVNTWWYTVQDANPTTPDPSFGIVGSTLSTTPLFDLSCSNVTSSSSSSSSSPSSTASSSTASGAASSASASLVSSARSAASNLPSSGGLTPSQTAGNGVGSGSASATASVTSSGTVPTGVSGSAGASSGLIPSGTAGNSSAIATGTPTSTGLALATAAAATFSGSMVGGALGAVVAIMAAL